MSKRKIILLIIIIAIIAIASLLVPRVVAYFQWQQAVEAAGGMPWQDGGTISMVRECVIDTPATSPTTCGISCPQVSASYGTACADYTQIDVQAQQGTTFLAPTKGFQYKGGGSYPKSGSQFIVGGASNILPWIIGIPAQ